MTDTTNTPMNVPTEGTPVADLPVNSAIGTVEDIPIIPVKVDAKEEKVSQEIAGTEEESVDKVEDNPTDSTDEEEEDDTPLIDVSKLHEMNYVELTQLQKDLNKNRTDMVNTLEAVKHIKTIYSSAEEMKDALKNAIEADEQMKDSEEDMMKYLEDSEKYEAEFQKNLKKFDLVISLVENEIEERYGNVKKTMRFWDDQTIEYLEKVKKEAIHSLGKPNITGREIQAYRDQIHNTELKLAIMEDRFEMKFWKERATLTAHIKRIEKDVRKDFLKSLADVLVGLHRINLGVTKESFVSFYSYLFSLVPVDEKDQNGVAIGRLTALVFMASMVKVGKNPDTVLYSTRLLNMVFGIMGETYDYTEEGKDKETMIRTLTEILGLYKDSISSTTKKMYERYMYKMQKGSKKKK